MTTTTGQALTADQAKANARSILEINGFRIRQDGQRISVDALDTDSVPNFYYSTALLTIAGDYQGLADGALHNLLSCPGLLADEIAAVMGQLAEAPTHDDYVRLRSGMEDRLEALADADVRNLLTRVLANLDDSWAFTRASRRIAVGLSKRAIEAFTDLTSAGRQAFGQLRVPLQALMGRPQPSQVEEAIDAIETAEGQLDELLDQFGSHCQAMLVPTDRVLDPREPLDSTANQPRMRMLERQLKAALPLDREHVEPLMEAIEQAAGMVMTLVTAMRQLDERLSMLGVTSA
jgi:hypothetical protein